MPRIKRKCPPLVVCDYPTEPNVLLGVAYDGGAKNGSFNEDARNVDPAEANVLVGVNYKIKNVAKVGSFDEAARNTDPGEANVADGVGYKILNAAKTGTLKPKLPKTDQLTSYATGDDGNLQDGNPVSPIFVDNLNNTVDDKASGLQWIQDHAAIGTVDGHNFTTYMTWADALAAVAALNVANYAGHNDWRLPNIKQLQSIVDYGRVGPAINTIFLNCQSGYYWSSTTYAGYAGSAWGVDFYDGDVNDGGKTHDFRVRPVRQY